MVYELDKDKFVSQMLRVIERKNTQTQEVLSGWFTPEEMKNKLGWSAKDKYSDKVYRYFVEYEDKESSAKSRTEMERHTTQGEDLEVEKKFEEGMLTKMSKITDLISKLDGYTQGDDAERVRRCNPEKSTTRIGICIRICTWACMVVPFLRVPLSQPIADLKTKMRDAMSKASAMASVEAQAKHLACEQVCELSS
ncbi:Uncharacterized protein SCF082_LOCUS40494 [Durusdinium trenchii]|uniref:Uncharacterized protein n=1 Tax=Durusdinium trenchii TaxID=1381693 RepID=A0ABP0QBV1_9DINO